MRIVCLGSNVTDSAIDIQGKQQQSGLTKPGVFDQIIGIFDRLSTMASKPAPPRNAITLNPNPAPIGAILGLGIVGLLLYKAVK